MDVCKLCNFDELNMNMWRERKEYLLEDACAEGTSDGIVTYDQIQTVSRGLTRGWNKEAPFANDIWVADRG